MGNVTKDQHFPRNPNYNDPGILGGTWTNTVTGEIWECVGHYNINALKVMDAGYIWYLKDDNSSGSGGGAKEPYIEETYDTDGYLTSVVMHGYTKVPSYKFSDDGKLQTFVDYGTTIKSIESGAFNSCTSLALTYLPSGLTIISDYAFTNCTSLALTSLPDGITSIGQEAFKNCTGLALTSLSSGLTIISDYAFMNCTSLALTSLPDGITSIGPRAFKNCTSLALTSLPDGITNIDTEAFDGCTSLALTSLPDGITSIGQKAFGGCTGLALTSLPSGLTSIPNYAFLDCNGLVSMSIHSGINAISPAAFGKCGGLTSVTFEGKPSGNMAKNIFQGCINLTEIKVPWAEGEVANAPWGATNATITYNYTGE